MSVIGQPIHSGCPISNLPPLIISVSPDKAIQGSSNKRVVISGFNLSNATVSCQTTGVSISSVSGTDTWVGFNITVSLTVSVGTVSITVSTVNGLTSFNFNILSYVYPGGIFKVYGDLISGGVWGTMLWGTDVWGYVSNQSWQKKPLYVRYNNSWYPAVLKRWDSTLSEWLLIDTKVNRNLVWGQVNWIKGNWDNAYAPGIYNVTNFGECSWQ